MSFLFHNMEFISGFDMTKAAQDINVLRCGVPDAKVIPGG
jgi:hypothetical protein